MFVDREASQEAETAAKMAVIEPPEDGDCLNLPEPVTGETYKDVHISPDLPPDKHQELGALICEYKHIFTDKPGTTDLVQHEVTLTSNEPVRTKPYPIPFAIKEVQTMLDLSAIEPSNSPYCSPMVIVKKQDG